jgi:adhesin/invasin
VRDQYGNDLTAGGLAVTFSASQGSISGATDNGDGTYTATFTAPLVLFPTGVTIRGFISGAQVTDTATVTVTVL